MRWIVCWVLFFGLVSTFAAVAAAGDPQPRAGVDGQDSASEDVEGGPLTEAEQFRLWTPLGADQLNAADPQFRHWVETIAAGRADKRVMRLYWYYHWRLQPFDRRIPADWRARGLAVLRDGERTRAAAEAFESDTPTAPAGSIVVVAAAREQAGAGTDAGPGVSPWGVWVPIGPYIIAGRTTGLDRPANEPDTLYAAVADGGVWRTRDRGQSWERLSDFEATLSGGSILLDPTDPRTIYFGTGEGNGAIDNYPGIGVLKSTDGGLTWTQSNEFSNVVRRLAIHESEPTRLYAAGAAGCYLSTDAGATFSLISATGLPTGTGASDVLIRPNNPDWVYCALWGGNDGGIYRSTDRGANWTRLTSGLPAPGTTGRIALAISRSDPQTLIAGIDINNGTVYRTDDGGDTWFAPAASSLAYCGGQCWYDNVVGIDPADPNVVYAGGVSAYRSLDGGVNWTNMSSGVHVDHHFILAPSAGEVLLANDGGIYHSADQGSSWAEWSLGMDTSQYYGICRADDDDHWAFGGTQDNGSHRRRPSDGWRQVLGADGGMCMYGPAGSDVIVGEYQTLNIRRSANGGESFGDANAGIPNGEPHPWVGILVADPTDRNNMWTATDRIYRSKDARATAWENVSDALHCASLIGCRTTTSIAVGPSDSNTVYAGFGAQGPVPPVSPGQRAGVYKSVNALDVSPTWTDVSSPSFPYRSIRRLRVHPDDANVVYAVIAGYGTEKIWKTSDGGVSWADHTGDLPDVPVNDIAIDADNPGTLVIATDLGVFRSDDDGASWYGFSVGLPTAAAIELTHDRATGKLRVGTHGRSMWDWQPSSTTALSVPDGASVGGTPMTLARLDSSTMRVYWDVRTCTAREYNLLWGDLDDVGARIYSGAECGLGTSGQADVPLPATASGNAFFVVVAADGAGTEGPHGFDVNGDPVPANGIGFCGVTNQDALATCP